MGIEPRENVMRRSSPNINEKLSTAAAAERIDAGESTAGSVSRGDFLSAVARQVAAAAAVLGMVAGAATPREARAIEIGGESRLFELFTYGAMSEYVTELLGLTHAEECLTCAERKATRCRLFESGSLVLTVCTATTVVLYCCCCNVCTAVRNL